jgi:hypothetical protein
MARPKTTQRAFRIMEPPSENASPTPRPMIATAPITCDTGPVSDVSSCCRGPSHGMPPPRPPRPKLPDCAVAVAIASRLATITSCVARVRHASG